MSPSVAVLGAGPAGLTAGYLLSRAGHEVVVLEADHTVGGLARTEVRDGFRFDLGGHRFFTKSPEVERLWEQVLGEELLLRRRLSRIYYRGRFLDYPLDARDVIRKLGPLELMRAMGSYLAAAVRPHRPEQTFEQWMCNRFGRRLYEMFFAAYTEKVWGVGGHELRAEWAAQRIRGLSFATAARAAVFGAQDGEVRSLVERFHYPRLGPGQMWEAMRAGLEAAGGEVHTATPVTAISISDGRVTEVRAGGRAFHPDHVISSLPLPTVAGMARPAPGRGVLEAAAGLRHREFVTVALVLDGPDPFPDNWLYIHDPGVRVARIQNFGAWSPWMVPDGARSCVGLEYFCFAGDEVWSMPDPALVALASQELGRIGLADPARVQQGYVVRVPKAYPIYDSDYQGRVVQIRTWLESIDNLQQVGRNGLHRYNNSDHSMLTAIRAVENLQGAAHDLWSVNADSWYHETEVPDEHPYRRVPEVAAVEPALSR
ncbi:MAG: NAD(P)/FAD-dependent oxidoreductase [Solirubrobacteraceae bacterium]